MKNLVLFISVFIATYSTHLYSQQVHFGIPEEGTIFYIEDIIIIDEIHWENGYAQFGEIGKRQVRKLDSLLYSLDTFKKEVSIHCFYGSSESFNQKVSEGIAKEIKRLLVFSKVNKNLIFMCLGNKRPLSNSEYFNEFQLSQLNTRIEIRLLRKNE
tara:strand:+ start:799 stop:1266 length:468 start_codon:yes stop_codon:yes gene_type:complete